MINSLCLEYFVERIKNLLYFCKIRRGVFFFLFFFDEEGVFLVFFKCTGRLYLPNCQLFDIFVQFVDLEGPKILLASDRFMADTARNYVSPFFPRSLESTLVKKHGKSP